MDSPLVGGDLVAIVVVDPHRFLLGAHRPRKMMNVTRPLKFRVNHPYKDCRNQHQGRQLPGPESTLAESKQTNPDFS